MKLSFVTIGLLIISYSHGLSQDTLKCWNGIDKLKWSDFKGHIPLDEEQSAKKAVSPTNIFIEPFRNEGVLTYKVKAIFYKSRAWKKDSTKQLLAHEQLHLDIAELYARKARLTVAEVLSKIDAPTSIDFKGPIENLLVEFRRTQNAYDNDTIHGLIENVQQEWAKKICLELESLKRYGSTPKDCN